MIVRCPSCQTHYRFAAPLAGSVDHGRCSQCEAWVPLVAIRAGYVVRSGGGLPRGMDDPLLADRFVATASAPNIGAAMTYRVSTDEAGAGLAADGSIAAQGQGSAPRGANGGGGEFQVVGTAAPGLDAVPLASGAESPQTARRPAPARPAARPRSARPTPSRPRSRLRRLALALLPAAVGATAGYYGTLLGWVEPLRIHGSVQTVDPTLVGGLLGLLLGWAASRWSDRRSH